MLQIAYRSRSKLPPGDSTKRGLEEIVKAARLRNERNNLTGFLLADREWFVQILEGEERAVRATLARIERDPRHTDLMLIDQRELRARSFPEWSMSSTTRSAENEDIFRRHGIGGDFDPRALVAPSIVALAMDLQDGERLRRLTPAASTGSRA